LQRNRVPIAAALFSVIFATSGCGDGSQEPSRYVSRSQSDSSRDFGATNTTLLAEGWHVIELMSASDYPQGPLRLGDPNLSCMVETEVIQATDASGNNIFDGRRTRGFRYIVRFKWSQLASGGLGGDDLTGSTTLFGSDWGPARIYLPERAEYLFQARASGSGRTGTVERCRFRVELRRERSPR